MREPVVRRALFFHCSSCKKRFFEKKECKKFAYIKKKQYLCTRFEKRGESVAQQVEHIPFKDGVLGSSPSWFTEELLNRSVGRFLLITNEIKYE